MESIEDIFEYRKTATDKVMSEARPNDNLVVERIELGNGIRIYLKGHIEPTKGMPTAEAIVAINTIKRFVIESLKLVNPLILLTISSKKAIYSFYRTTWRIISPFILKIEFQNEITREITNMLTEIFMGLNIKKHNAYRVALTLAHVIEYDEAYRLRLKDLFSETTREKLYKNPRKEIKRLLKLSQERDSKKVSKKIHKIGTLISYILLIPKYKHLFKEAIYYSNFKNLQFDQSELYWIKFKKDYNYQGLNKTT